VDFVVVESPFATSFLNLRRESGAEWTKELTQEVNVRYARACLHDCLTRHQEAPYASHLLYTQEGVLDDDIPAERDLGIRAGLQIGRAAKRRVFYVDRGFSRGMVWGLRFALDIEQPCEIRRLGGEWELGWEPGFDLEAAKTRLRE
jgi:hypothetical protein